MLPHGSNRDWNLFLRSELETALPGGIRERLAESRVPKALQGLPIAFICAGLMALAFMGFNKLFGITV